MFRKLVPLVVVSFLGVVVVPLPQQASASTPLTRAVVRKLRNWVQLMPQNQPKRRARIKDSMTPGDGLSTGRASLADLRFNDGSLARIGERAVFRFVPRTRTFRLSNGTVLLLIPPGQGRTRVKTRSAAATIRGSALFVRYDKQTDTTVVGSLTNSGIEVFNKDESRSQILKAGQLIVLIKGEIQGLYDFDLRTFYNTSDLVRGLDLTRSSDKIPLDPAIASVQAETSEALAKQLPIEGEKVVENPSFIELSAGSSDIADEDFAEDNLPVNSLVDTGQVIFNTSKKNEDKSYSNNGNIPEQAPSTPTTIATPVEPQAPSTPPTDMVTPVEPQTPSTPPTDMVTPVEPQTPSTPPTDVVTPVEPQTPQTPPTDVVTPVEPQTPSTPPNNNGNPVEPQTPNPEPVNPTPKPTIPKKHPST